MTKFFSSSSCEGRKDPNTTISGHSPNIECWLGSFVIFQGIRASIAKKPYIFVIFGGGGGYFLVFVNFSPFFYQKKYFSP